LHLASTQHPFGFARTTRDDLLVAHCALERETFEKGAGLMVPDLTNGKVVKRLREWAWEGGGMAKTSFLSF
jgi:hypothetical protein